MNSLGTEMEFTTVYKVISVSSPCKVLYMLNCHRNQIKSSKHIDEKGRKRSTLIRSALLLTEKISSLYKGHYVKQAQLKA